MPEVVKLRLSSIYPNPRQPRKVFESEPLQELARNIASMGLKQPVTVVNRPNGEADHMLVAGERRWRACCLAGLQEIPAIIEEMSDAQVADFALVENLLREDLNLIEEANGYRSMLENERTMEQLGALLGMKQTWRIQERLNLLRLDEKFQDALVRGALTPSQAQEMSKLSIEGQWMIWRAIQDGRCDSYAKLRRLVGAVSDQESQQDLFKKEEQLTESDRRSLSKVDQFVSSAGRLLGSITEEDLTVIESVAKSDAAACIARLELLIRISRHVKDALTTSLARQEISNLEAA